ncbi:ABC transporter ATP-binding protein [Pseudoroseicyclus tamaricis]|uniref:ABC transporter ATP-binding protein n=1 Tax=Pseudoroseicyclus tamaricis TaxID=2705421 RepID=A0A6B2K3L7_9RHOB|nr:ABC transporter ATP-binding protein [Pseudoroseicyclus tamaricis]NDV01186.1 ABC transporter ATP-binding protein [Pseudoroseicyclus tamaricis]
MTGKAIRVEGVRKEFGRVTALDGVSLEVPAGSHFAILGPNGAGKSTLIDILCTITQADAGQAEVAGFDVRKSPRDVRQRIGVVFQDPTVDTRLTVRENLDFHGLVYRMKGAHRRRRITEMLELVELADRAETPVRTLSSGMKRRLEIARGLLHEPQLLFLDEPTVGLDAQSRARIWEYIAELRTRSELTVVVTTHYIDEVDNCDRVVVIDKGQVRADATPSALKAEHGRTVLRGRPLSPAAAERLLAQFPGAARATDGRLAIPVDDPVALGRMLQETGGELDQIEIDQPSLESVFLSLTGRDLREEPASPRGGRKGRRG